MRIAAALSVLVAFSTGAEAAQRAAGPQFATRPVRLIVANGPGSAPDVVARLLAGKLGEAWGHPVVVDNRTGAVYRS